MPSTHFSPSFAYVVAVVTSATVGQAVRLQPARLHDSFDAATHLNQSWIENSSQWLSVPQNIHNNITAIVTFAGKRNPEYIDAAVMLGLSLKKHLPSGYPMVALAIDGMKFQMQNLLRRAGWSLVFVENWEGEYCNEGCDMEFLGRWHDSFEKINTFRLPFSRVLFMDADTYVFSDRLQEVLTSTQLPDGHIAMSPDGCKDEFNSGVMLFRPSVDVFRDMLTLISKRSREQILDQTIINDIYAGRIVELDREFNCVDTLGVQPGSKTECQKRCKDVVVAHFTGHPKPTAAKRRLLELVRRPGAPATSARNTNFGSTSKWSAYYCDIRENRRKLSKDLQFWLHKTGKCCHAPFDPKLDDESCKECPASLAIKTSALVSSAHRLGQDIDGTYMKSTIQSTKINGDKPIFIKPNLEGGKHLYLYYIQKQLLWMIGENYTSNFALSYAGSDAQCPRDAGAWHFILNGTWTMQPTSVKTVVMPGSSAADDAQIMKFDVERHQWVSGSTDITDEYDWDDGTAPNVEEDDSDHELIKM